MSVLLIVLIVLLAVSLINTILFLLIDFRKINDMVTHRIMGGVFTWLLLLISYIIYQIKEYKKRKKRKSAKNKDKKA